ncbi:MAG: hypothetical protein PHO15_05820 [Eubacteriales bacterium]|nr:hypothetical protein [Eubacteriales bacterium]
MSYESRIYVVRKTKAPTFDGSVYAEKIAMFELRKMVGFVNIFKQETDCHFFSDDGDTEIIHDSCGYRIKEAPIKDVIKYLENFSANEEYYWRIRPLLQMLIALENCNVTILHYGH